MPASSKRTPHILSASAISVLLVWLAVVGHALATPVGQVPGQVSAVAQRLDQQAQVVDGQASAGNWNEARRQWRDLGETWLDVEDGFRDVSRTAYVDIESSMVRVGDQLRGDPPDPQAVRLELMDFRRLL